jgi:hypothetical protein
VWTDAQRAAVESAVTDFAMTAKQALEAARTGTLPGRGAELGPFAPPLGTIASWATEARRDERAKEVAGMRPENVLEQLCVELTAELARHVKRLRSRRQAGKPEEIGLLARQGVEVAKLRKTIDGAGMAKPAKGESDRPAQDDFVSGLAERERSGSAARRQREGQEQGEVGGAVAKRTIDGPLSHPASGVVQHSTTLPSLA